MAAAGSPCTMPAKPRKSLPIFRRNSACIRLSRFTAAGLGILAGDHCKEASDLGVPARGHRLHVSPRLFPPTDHAEGWQEAAYAPFNREDSPIHPALTPSGEPCRFTVDMGGRNVTAVVWKVLVGRIPLYLIDTDVPENSAGEPGALRSSLRRRPGDAALPRNPVGYRRRPSSPCP